MQVMSDIIAVVVVCSLAYCILVLGAGRSYLKARFTLRAEEEGRSYCPPISVLKPLCGLDHGLEDNLRSFFAQDYPEFELLVGVHRADDPSVAVFEQIRSEYPQQDRARLIVTGDSPVPNAKAYSLKRLVREANYDLLVMGDSDVRVKPDFLQGIAEEFSDPQVGLVTCPYHAVGGPSVWSHLEAIGMNTEFLGGVLVARLLEGMKFALGCAVAIRGNVLEAMGGFQYLQDYLAEDFVMGQRTAQSGYKVLLSAAVIEHRIGSQGMRQSLSHRLRWARSTRRSRPAGYWGQLFTYPLPWALLLLVLNPNAWPLVLLTLLVRAAAAWVTSARVLGQPLTFKQWTILPLQDVLGFLVWMGGFLGDTVIWRDRKCTILPDGKLYPQDL